MKYGIISADVINSTKLTVEELQNLRKTFELFFGEWGEKLHFWGRIVRGDFLEICVSEPKNLLRIALMLKCIAKSADVHNGKETTLFRANGLRIAISVGAMDVVNQEADLLSGEAITLTGRKVDAKAAVSKGTLTMLLGEGLTNHGEDAIASLCDAVINRCTSKQSFILTKKLQFVGDTQIAATLGITKSAVSQHIAAANWNAIEKALNYFESLTWN